MKIRLMGTREECQQVKEIIGSAENAVGEYLHIREASSFYPNRGETELGRLYLEIEPRR